MSFVMSNEINFCSVSDCIDYDSHSMSSTDDMLTGG